MEPLSSEERLMSFRLVMLVVDGGLIVKGGLPIIDSVEEVRFCQI